MKTHTRRSRALGFGRIARSLVLVTASALVLAGCSGTGNDTGNSDDTGSTPSTGQDMAAAKARVEAAMQPIDNLELDLESLNAGVADLSGKKVLIVPVSAVLFGPWTNAISAILAETGAESAVCDGKALPTEVATCMENAATVHGADIVITIAVSPSLVQNAYQALEDQGIPVLGAWQNPEDSEINELRRFMDSTPANEASGKLGFDYILANIDEPSLLDIGIKDNPAVSAVSDNMTKWFTDQCPECEISSQRITSAEAAQAASLVSSQLLTTPDLNAISAFNLDGQGTPILDGLRTVDKTADDVMVCGKAGGMAAIQLLQEGKVTCVALISTYYQSWVIVDALLRLLGDQPALEYPQAVRLFDASNSADLEISPEKLGTFEWFGTPTFEDDFTAAWGLS